MVIMLGVGLTYAALPILIAETAPPERLSEITGMLAVVRAGSMAIGTQIIVVLLAVSTVKRDGLSYPSPEAFHSVFLFTIVTSLLSLLGFCFLPRRGTPNAVAVSSSEGTRLHVQRPV
jgi:MFS family permease